MSVLIKGMKMPTACLSCDFCNPFVDEPYCRRLMKRTPKITRHDECPLIEIPPHGRLIDVDDLDNAFTALRFKGEELAHWGDRKDWCLHGNEIEELIKRAPTIIEAEVEE